MLTLSGRRLPALAPWRDIDGFENRISRLLGEPFGETEPFGWTPAVNVVETEACLLYTSPSPRD